MTEQAPSIGRQGDGTRTHPVVRLGVSRCLLGDNVRVSGGHCQDRWILDVLGPHASFVGVCPEVEIGLPSPRPPMRLALTDNSQGPDDVRLIESKSGKEWTETMGAHVDARVEELASLGLHGFILKKDSPTCGVFRVKVYDHNGSPSRRGQGVFAQALARRLPDLPIEEDGRLNDSPLREAFLVRIYAYARWQEYLATDGSLAGLGTFHARHKMLLLAANPTVAKELGQLVAGNAGGLSFGPELLARYEKVLMRALVRPVSRGRHVNVLQHLLGFCKEAISSSEKAELARLLSLFSQGLLPRAVPVALVRYLLLQHDAPKWASEQMYLEAYPPQLAGEA